MAEAIKRRRRKPAPTQMRRAPHAPEDQGIVIQEPPLPRRINSWVNSLAPLLKKPYMGRWCLIQTFETPEQAQTGQKNCSQRKVRIPEPDGDWSFAARGCELYAIYRGLTPKSRTRRK